MGTATHENATHRMVVLLKPSEKQRVLALAREENVSLSEIVRRSLESYESEASSHERQGLMELLGEMNNALDMALDSVRSARAEVRENLDEIEARRKQRA